MDTHSIQTKRLKLRPRTMAEMERLLACEQDPEMRKAYGEMIAAMQLLPGREEWAADWAICLSDGSIVGGVGFKGPPDGSGTVELGYGIDPPYRRQGYAREAVSGILRWAFLQPGVRCVTAQTEPGNEISQRVLLKNGFRQDGQGAEGPLYKTYPSAGERE